MFRRIYTRVLVFAAIACIPINAFADCHDLDRPNGDIILTISGNIACTNAPGRADFDLQMLDALPRKTLKTTTPWTKGMQEFSGVTLRQLIELVQVRTTTLRAMAHNDYQVDIPVKDTTMTDVLVATRHNGKIMTLRTRGPVRIIYPDSSPFPKSFQRMIWQLRSLHAKD